MVGYKDNHTTILTAIPTVPPTFTNVSNPLAPGTYLLGHTHMVAADIPITSFWHRTLTDSDDILLGVLTIFLIAIISEIVSSIILRTRRAPISATAVRAAYALEQFSRMRSIRAAFYEPRYRCRYLFALVIAISVFAVDVIFLLLTQPAFIHSTKSQYNVVAFQPVSTTRGRATYIRRLAGDRICMTPLVLDAKQRRNYAISACFRTDSKQPSDDQAAYAYNMTMKSWYHQGGSDHNITFGDGWHSVSARAYMYAESDIEGGKHILFNSSTNAEHAFYVQELVMYASMEWACNERKNGRQALQGCEGLVSGYKVQSRGLEERDVVLWRGKKSDVAERVNGSVTMFRFGERLREPFGAINSGLRVLFTTGVIYEGEGNGAYARLSDDKRESGIAGLISEEGRVAGVWLMSVLLGSVLLLTVVVRVVLRPTSLGEVAMLQGRQDERVVVVDGEGDVFDKWEEEEREMVKSRVGGGGVVPDKMMDACRTDAVVEQASEWRARWDTGTTVLHEDASRGWKGRGKGWGGEVMLTGEQVT